MPYSALTKSTAIIITLLVIIGILAGIAWWGWSRTPGPATTTTAPPTTTTTTTAPPQAELVIYHWWTAGGEREAINAVFQVFKQNYPNIQIVENPVAGGAGSVMKSVIIGLLAAGTPPDTFQVHAGAELKEYVDAGYLAPIDDIWSELGLDKVIPSTLQAMCKFNGHYYAVPINVHRSNVLWYNPKIFNELGIIDKFGDPRSWSIDTLLEVARYIKQQRPDIAPIALASRNKWPVTHLFEVLLANAGGPETYVKFFTGKFNYNDPNDPVAQTVKKVLTVMATMAKEGLFNSNHPELTWDQAAALVAEGKAAMYIHGDWVAGYYIANNYKYGEDWAAAPFPKNIFILLSDSFELPENAPHPEAAKDWLMVVGSKEAQEKFNLIKGSIPARTDVSPEYPDPYRPETAEDFQKSTLIPSAVHGGIAKEAFMTDLHNILTSMLTAVSVGTPVDSAVNTALTQILQSVETSGLVSFWEGYTIDHFITKR
ncbi:ABC transporter substrate-binding protein [Staphylothermus hellenicus]|uniref:Extracellular solute-binding protein family 1 n=1 Tax=Staphylothermus hellenicus (strain DSM 12710 / JCM 10830 / BK20S6-10-b1 / P8) TaxID=591019 RepID=D7D9X7_STAHD|nr:extracellular solute-binding protein [Staphylothermus hellenicus]ADI32573.1 extracellular solute-binding protein family 1 [Staphylothermus hellenicus DSM 12710]